MTNVGGGDGGARLTEAERMDCGMSAYRRTYCDETKTENARLDK